MYLDEIKNIKTYRSGKPQFANSFRYWRNQLFNQVNKLFTWEGLPFPQKEIETRLALYGFCGVLKGTNGMLASDINMYGLTDYYDEFTQLNYVTPLQNGTRTIHKDAVVVDNNTLRNATINIIDRYAMLLAHTEITFINALVNGRANKTSIATSNKQAESIRQYQNKLYNGSSDVIVDSSFVGIEIKDNDNTYLKDIKSIYDVRQNILYSFYEDLGIKKNQQKRERLVSDEIEADNSLLKLNIKDMFEARKKAVDEINKIFGTSWRVKCNVDYDSDGIVDIDGDSLKESEGNNSENN